MRNFICVYIFLIAVNFRRSSPWKGLQSTRSIFKKAEALIKHEPPTIQKYAITKVMKTKKPVELLSLTDPMNVSITSPFPTNPKGKRQRRRRKNYQSTTQTYRNRRTKSSRSRAPPNRRQQDSVPKKEGGWMQIYREEQLISDYVNCHKLVTPFLNGEKLHPRNIALIQYIGPSSFICLRIIQILNMNMTMFDMDDIQGLMRTVIHTKFRLYNWHYNAMKLLLNTIIIGKTHNFNTLRLGIKQILKKWNIRYTNTTSLLQNARIFRPPCLRDVLPGFTRHTPRLAIRTNTKPKVTTVCRNQTDYVENPSWDHIYESEFEEPYKAEYNIDMARERKGRSKMQKDLVRVDEVKNEESKMNLTENQGKNNQSNLTNLKDTAKDYDQYEGDKDQSSEILRSEEEVDNPLEADYDDEIVDSIKQGSIEDELYKAKLGDADEVKRAKLDQYDLEDTEFAEQYDLLNIDTNYNGPDDVATESYDDIIDKKEITTSGLKSLTDEMTGKENTDHTSIPYYYDLKDQNLQYEYVTETGINQNQEKNKGEAVKGAEEKIYAEAEEYIENLFAGLDTK